MVPEQSDRTAETGEFDRLARRYLDLWQSQLAGLAADQALTEQIARLFAAANAQMSAILQANQGAPHAPPSGTAPVAAAPQHGADDLGELRKRLAALEARVAELEARRSA